MRRQAPFLAFFFLAAAAASAVAQGEVDGWQPYSPRDEVRPGFSAAPNGGPTGMGGLRIKHDDREGLGRIRHP